jgi:hypothetical protein
VTEEAREADIEQIVLNFTPGSCDGCGASGPPGPCEECGGEITLPGIDPLIEARQKALGASTLRAEELLVEFDRLPEARIPVSGDQFAAIVREADLSGSVTAVLGLVDDLRGIDMGSPKLLGGKIRVLVETGLEKVEALLELCRELASFDPDGDAAELRETLLEGGRYGAAVVARLLRTATADSYAECLAEYTGLEEMLDGEMGARLREVATRAENWEEDGIDGRLAVALGMPELATEDGDLEVASVLMAFAEEEEPHAAIAARARGYFEHVLGSSADPEAGDSILMAPLFLLASTLRPLRAHRAARLLVEVLTEANGKDPRAVQALLEQTVDQGPIIYSALGRVQRGFEAFEEDDDEELILQQLMAVYVELSESAFRTIGWLAVRLAAVNAGEEPDMDAEPPTLGRLGQELGRRGALGALFAESSDSELRNAAAHSQYGWDRETEEVKDLRTGRRWSVEELVDRIHNLFGCLAGFEAGYACFLVDTQIDLKAPSWLADFPSALQLLVEFCFAPRGLTVVETRDAGADIVIEPLQEIDPARLIPPLGGMPALSPRAETFQISVPDGKRPLIELSAEAIREAHAAGDLQDLKMVELAFESAVRTGRSTKGTADEFAVVLAKVVAASGLRALNEGALDRGTFKVLRRRLATVNRFAREASATDDPQMRDLRARLGKLQALARSASSGGSGALGRLDTQLRGLEQWADSKGVRWPPVMAAD